MDTEQLKRLLLSIEADIKGKHPDSPIYFHQQEAKKTNMALMEIKTKLFGLTLGGLAFQ